MPMLEEQELRKHYKDVMAPLLLLLERKRQRLLLYAALYFGLGLTVLLLVANQQILVLTLTVLALLVLIGYLGSRRIEKFALHFKKSLTPHILQLINPSLRYYASGYLPKDSFIRSRLFFPIPEFYIGEDLIRGMLGEMLIECCELDVRFGSEGLGQIKPLFKGRFIHVILPLPYEGWLIFIPKTMLELAYRTAQAAHLAGGSVMLSGNIDIDQRFIIYSDRQSTVRDHCTPHFSETIVHFAERANDRFLLSIIDHHFYLAQWTEADFLEPNFWRRNSNLFEDSYRLYREMYALIATVEQLRFYR